jgi:putative hemolysin
MCGVDPNVEEDDVSKESIQMMVDAGTEKGVLEEDEKEIIQNLCEFDDLTVGEFATHRTEIALLWKEESVEEWDQTTHDSRHTCFPICDETVDNIIGILNAKDYFRLANRTKEEIMEKAVHSAYFVPSTVRADVMFRQMKQSRKHFAVVLDEYGGTLGIVTMNDLLEQLVGDLDDNAQAPEEPDEIQPLDSGTWRISGTAPLTDVAEQLGTELPVEEYDTFAGLVFGLYGSVPDDGTTFEIDIENLHIKVTEIRDHRLEAATVCLTEKEEDVSETDEEK